jgi:hypothetical protein
MRSWYGLIILAGLSPAFLAAENLSPTACPGDSLAYYESHFSSTQVGAENGPCSAGILNFSGFTFQGSGNGAVTDEDIFLTPISPGQGETGETGFTIGGLSVDADQSATYVIDWYFAIDNGPYAGGASLGMDPPYGDVTFVQDYCVDSFMSQYSPDTPFAPPTCGVRQGGPEVQSLTVTVADQQESILFDPVAHNFATVRTIIQLNGGTTGAGFDLLTGSTSINASTPEPATLGLIPAGLMMLYFLRKRLVKRQV